MNWTILLDTNLEKILPVRHVVREPGIPLSMGRAYRNWRADYTFSIAGDPYVVEVKVGESDYPLGAMKVLAYQKLYNIHTGRNYKSLIVSRKSRTNSADLLACALLKVSLLVLDFQEQADKSVFFTAKLDGSIAYQAFVNQPQDRTITRINPNNPKALLIEPIAKS